MLAVHLHVNISYKRLPIANKIQNVPTANAHSRLVAHANTSVKKRVGLNQEIINDDVLYDAVIQYINNQVRLFYFSASGWINSYIDIAWLPIHLNVMLNYQTIIIIIINPWNTTLKINKMFMSASCHIKACLDICRAKLLYSLTLPLWPVAFYLLLLSWCPQWFGFYCLCKNNISSHYCMACQVGLAHQWPDWPCVLFM